MNMNEVQSDVVREQQEEKNKDEQNELNLQDLDEDPPSPSYDTAEPIPYSIRGHGPPSYSIRGYGPPPHGKRGYRMAASCSCGHTEKPKYHTKRYQRSSALDLRLFRSLGKADDSEANNRQRVTASSMWYTDSMMQHRFAMKQMATYGCRKLHFQQQQQQQAER